VRRNKRWLRVGLGVAVAIAVVAGVGCGSDEAADSEDVTATQRPPSRGPAGPVGTEQKIDTIGGLLSGKPLFDADFADPFVLATGNVAYAYATNTDSANIPVMRTAGGTEADYLGDALPDLPSWTTKGDVWAPAVWAISEDSYVMYYATRDTASGRQCISRATANSPAGPFTDDSDSAFVCPLDLGGAIDPAVVVDGTDAYLIYKSDGNCCDIPTSIWSVPLSADGLSTTGNPSKLITNDQAWEKGVVEGPSMIKSDDKYLLFFSGNDWSTADYAVGYAVCASVTGPCTKSDDNPWLKSTDFAQGPGGQEFFDAQGDVWMVYHGWLPGQVDTPGGERRLYLDEVAVANYKPTRVGAERTFDSLVRLLVVVLIVVAAVVAGAVWWFRRRRSAVAQAT